MVGADEEEEGEGDVIMPGADDDSSEEEEDDNEDEAKRIAEGFLVDDDEEDEDEDEDADERRRRKRRKRHHRRKRMPLPSYPCSSLMLPFQSGTRKKVSRMTILNFLKRIPEPPSKGAVDSLGFDAAMTLSRLQRLPPLDMLLGLNLQTMTWILKNQNVPRIFTVFLTVTTTTTTATPSSSRTMINQGTRKLVPSVGGRSVSLSRNTVSKDLRIHLLALTQSTFTYLSVEPPTDLKRPHSAWDEIHEIFGDGRDYEWAMELDGDEGDEEDQVKPRFTDVRLVRVLPLFNSYNVIRFSSQQKSALVY